ncbi:MAG: hypothetical protein D6696_02150 [Acidobacteria bacterium]|nr:MAG: hypothetical protein D6696_02150 [Acidobacteriota bacterium]
MPGPLLAFATGVAAILGRLEGAPPAAERIDAAEIFDLAADGPALERPPSRTVAVRTPPAAAAEPPPAAAERAAEEIACHHCGHRQPPAPRCARCGAVFLAYRRQPESRLAAPVAGDLAAGTVESPSRWGLTFLAGESLASLVLAQLGQHASALLAIAVTPWLAAVGGIAILALLTSLPSTAAGGAVFSLAAYSLSVTAVAIFVDRNLEGRPPTVGQALGSALRVLPAVLASRLLATLRILLGLAALIVPGLIYAQRAAFIEILAACQPEGRPDVSRGQMSRNLVDGYEASVLAYLLLAALAGFALIGLPAYAAVLLDFLGLEWLVPLDSPPFLALGVLIALGLAALALTGWAVLLYFLYRELADQQGMALYRGAEGLDLLARFVLITDLILLLLAVYRTSGLVG